LKLGSGIAPIDELLDRGICVSLGTDGVSSNNNLSIVKEMAFASLLRKGIKEDPTLIPAHTALKMATYMGAEALAWQDEIGSIEIGKQADIILINTRGPNYQPKVDMESHLVYSGHTGDVDSVWVAGKKLMENRRLLTIDLEQVYREVENIKAKIMG
jgi:5-methylthioadenosine/S-adenosylhomocysteine deaminase